MAILLRSTAEKYESRGSIASDRVSYIEIVDDVGSRFFQPRDCIDIRPARGPFPRSIFRCLVFDSFFSLFFFLSSPPIRSSLREKFPNSTFDRSSLRRSSPNFTPDFSNRIPCSRSPKLAGVGETAARCVYRIDWKLCAATRY